MEIERVQITTPFIKLGALLKLAGLVETGGVGAAIIAEGLVTVNGEVCTQRGRKLYPGDKAVVEDQLCLEVVHADHRD